MLAIGITTPVEAQASQPGSETFSFGSFEDHGDFIHCAVRVTPNPADPTELLPSDETCFEEQTDSISFALGGGEAADAAALRYSARAVVPDGLIAIHYTGPNFSGGSFALAGTNCDGGGVTLTGGAWDNIIDSTANGCSNIEHYDISSDFVFEPPMESTTGGGGNLGLLKNRTSGILYKGDLADPVNLVGLEVNQGIQDWEGNAQLVKGRPTTVRAFLEPTAGAFPEPAAGAFALVVGRLYMDTVEGNTYGPLLPINSGGRFVALPDAADRRSTFGSSLNFRLPNFWTQVDGTLRLEVLGGGANCQESRFPANTCSADMSFVDVAVPRARILSVSYNTPAGSVIPTYPQLEEQAARIQTLLPISGLDYELGILINRFDTKPTVGDVNSALLAARTLDGSPSVYLGMLRGSSPDSNGGSASGVPGNSAAWYTAGTEDRDSGGYARNRGPHEFAHTFGVGHAKETVGTDTNHTICRGDSGGASPDSPYFLDDYKISRDPDGDGTFEDWAMLGPNNNSNIEDDAWGIDYRYLSQPSSPLLVVDPEEVYAFMSYCNSKKNDTQVRWIDMQYWDYVIEEINLVDWTAGPVPGADVDTESFMGTVIFGADGAASDVEMSRVLTVRPTSTPIAQPDGPYLLELVDSGGSIVASRSFSPYEYDADGGENGDDSGPSYLFAVSIENPPAYESFRISVAGNTLTNVNRSPNAPEIAITSPNAGDVINGDTIELTWAASDPDGDALTYLVQYSTDGGTNYETIAVDYDQQTLTIDRARLPGSTQVRYRVVASDGTRSATAESAVFTVAGNAPLVTIVAPNPGDVFTDLQTMVLEATGYDTENGVLDATSLAWSSDIDGPLGAEGFLVLEAASLTPGVHVLTVTATDSDGQSSSQTVQVTIGERNEPPIVIDDDAFVELGDTVDIDVLVNDSDLENDLDESTLTIVTPPSLGTATVESSVTAGFFVRYAAGASGTDTMVYEVCDSNGQCATATVTITVGTDDCTITGTEGNDVLVGTSGDDIICGLGGDDVIRGLGGNDVIRGGRGNDILKGGAGDDVIRGGRGADTIRGQAGQDTLYGGRGADELFGGGGNDVIRGGRGSDVIGGGGGNDTIFGGAGADTVSGGRGADVIRGNRGSDVLHGNRGADKIYGGRQADEIFGDRGRDWLYGRRGADVIRGGRGDDHLFGNRGADVLWGGPGADVIRGGRGVDDAFGGAGVDECFAEFESSCE